MEGNNIIKYEGKLVQQVGNALSITNKLLSLFSLEFIPYRKGKKWGFCDRNKKIKIECKYDIVYPFSEGLALAKFLNDYFFIDSLENKIVYYKKSDTYRFDIEGRVLQEGFKNGVALIYSKESSGYGIINKKNCVILNCSFSKFEYFNNFIVAEGHNGDKWAYSYDGLLINQESFRDINSYFSEGMALVYQYIDYGILQKNYYGFINEDGKLITSCIYDGPDDFSCGLARVYLYGKRGFIDKTGKWLFESQANQFKEGLAVEFVQSKNEGDITHRIINVKGEIEFECSYDFVGNFSKGICKVELNGKVGFIDKKGNVVIDFENVKDVESTSLNIQINKEIVQILYDKVEIKYKNGNKKVVTYNNHFVPFPKTADWHDKLSQYFITTREYYRYGLVDKNGEIIISLNYNSLIEANNDLFRVRWQSDSEYGYIDINETKYWED